MPFLILLYLSISFASSPPSQEINPTVLAALITAAGASLAAIISATVAIYQARRNIKLEKEKIAIQRDAQVQIDRERISHEHEMETLQAHQERQRQRREMNEEEARLAVERAQTMDERIQAYRQALCADPRISKLQILDMTHPLDITNMFVKVQLHGKPEVSYKLDPVLLSAEEQRDPNELFRANRAYLERRMKDAIEPEEAVQQYQRCVFTGDPGAGKTTLLRYLTLKAANGQLHNLPDFPIYIELNHFASSGYHDLLDFISTRWDDRYGFPKGDARSCIEEHLKEGKALLLLDALDETVIGNSIDTAEHSYQRISDAITELAARYHQSAIVVTVRKASYLKHNRLSGFTELELVDFRPEDMDRFMDNWFLNSTEPGAPTSARDLKAKLSRNVRLQALAANPLLMTLLLSFTEIR